MPVYDKYNFLLLPKMLVLNPKDGSPNWEWHLPDFVQAKKELQKFGRLIVDTKR